MRGLSLYVVTLGCTTLVACAGETASTPNVARVQVGEFRPAAIRPGTPPRVGERAAAAFLARTFALAMRSPLLRHDIKRALATSGVKEQKLHLSTYLSGRGSVIIDEIGKTVGVSGAQLQDAIGQVRDLELYMPVRRHRKQWNGNAAAAVAIALTEDESPVVFDTTGQSSYLNRVFPPAYAVIGIVPVESDFANQDRLNLQGRPELACTVDDDSTLEAAAEECRALNRVRRANVTEVELEGIYVTRVEFARDECGRECWLWGDPEYEIHAMSNRTPPERDVHNCAAAYPVQTRKDYYDQNGQTWAGKVRILTAADITTMRTYGDSTWGLMFVEDDAYQCQNNIGLATSIDYFFQMVGNAMGASVLWSFGSPGQVVAIYAGLASVYSLAGVLANGADDFIGIAIPCSNTPYSCAAKFAIIGVNQRYEGTAAIEPYSAAGPYIGPTAQVRVSSVSSNSYMPLGSGFQLSAYGLDEYGTPTGASVTAWSSSNPAVVTVSSTGWIAANAVGTATITATIEGKTGSTTINVAAIGSPVELRLSSSLVSLRAGETTTLYARLYDSHGFEVPVDERFQWTYTSESCVVSGVGQEGYVEAAYEGGSWLTATSDVDVFQASVYCSVGGVIE